MELRCLCKCLLKHLMVRRFLRESGREFQTDDPENARLVLHRSMGGKEREREYPTSVVLIVYLSVSCPDLT